MKPKQEKVNDALTKLNDLCLSCEKHFDTCQVAVAKRAISTLKSSKVK